ncbi:hypothetical protein [Streptomyces sp. Qhu_M48]|uniref:hypothetical protein n=1 Tax=Streptomyces sp. Qhu_M48 TaxID=3435889 RepID=UPI003F4F4711
MHTNVRKLPAAPVITMAMVRGTSTIAFAETAEPTPVEEGVGQPWPPSEEDESGFTPAPAEEAELPPATDTPYGRCHAARLLVIGAAVSAVLVSGGCSPEKEDAPTPSQPPGSSSPTATKTLDERSKGSVDVAPTIPDADAIAAVSNIRGNMAVPLTGGVRKGSLGIMVSCKGKGTVRVTFEPSGLAFPLECVDQVVSTTYNQIDLKYDRSSAHVHVEAPGSVRWAMTVGQ